MSSLLPFMAKAEVRDTTRMPLRRARAMISSSVRPSLKYSFSGSDVRLTNGRTAMAGARGARGTAANETWETEPAGAPAPRKRRRESRRSEAEGKRSAGDFAMALERSEEATAEI